ncbi:hypothetical protein SDRG_15406 [Saprolegnia diclina VS20]|uniref:Major facilitator superfamily (MFS) profile domain-containing protein n=1 Tax=Saprolegnia diclina (strain VS20) TaxID=1156394 RepID=T0PWX1_SAPDV|nr:hypothetical protein SDRG_15406 [Saprolegnia diclina VS20]EQC26756.1 hypothetical protein SDRG_15406 [Saprolegnia diclina VS20]|eukprot:XP_008619799.1 hypothetical protein SDRG_15406 [Saprolegnia diclina VS20]
MINKFFLRGLGFFNDAYDLSVVNIVNIILKHQYKEDYTSDMKSNVSTAALIGAVLGQLTFGFLGDMYGRKNCMIATCAILIVGGILTAAAYGGSDHATLWFLVIARGVLGFGIGGEYPLAASSSSEDATSPADRNRRVSLTFSLQGVGFLVAGVLGLIMVNALDETDQNLEIMWRVLFGFGVLPALFLVYYRITAEETHVYKTMLAEEVHMKKIRWSFIIRHYWKSLLGTAGTWFLFDIVFGYVGTWFTFAGISVLTILLTVFCMFDNNDEASVMDNDFKAKLAMEDDDVRKSFVSQMEEPINGDDIGAKA